MKSLSELLLFIWSVEWASEHVAHKPYYWFNLFPYISPFLYFFFLLERRKKQTYKSTTTQQIPVLLTIEETH